MPLDINHRKLNRIWNRSYPLILTKLSIRHYELKNNWLSHKTLSMSISLIPDSQLNNYEHILLLIKIKKNKIWAHSNIDWLINYIFVVRLFSSYHVAFFKICLFRLFFIIMLRFSKVNLTKFKPKLALMQRQKLLYDNSLGPMGHDKETSQKVQLLHKRYIYHEVH